MRLLILLFLVSQIAIAQNDKKIEGSIAIVKNSEGVVIISKYFDNARIESPHTISVYEAVKDVPKSDLKELADGEYIEKDKIYLIDGEAYIATKGGKKNKSDSDLMGYFDTKTKKEK